MFSVNSLTDAEADQIAQAYFRSGKNHKRMAEILGLEYFDLNLFGHPVVKNKILLLAKLQSRKYGLDEHLDKLKEIRDLCMGEQDRNLKVALSAEIALGKAAGLYDLNRKEEDPDTDVDPEKLTSEEIRALLAKRGVVSVNSLPSPEDIAGSELREDPIR